MVEFLTGDITEANAECLINTVNCEGFMGKGIAYQFKLLYPENEKEYIKACKAGKVKIGALFTYYEKEKVIINFPTKDKWREKSQYGYIEKGMDSLIEYLNKNNYSSIAIPPLGCGNGGLEWIEVKKVILKHIEPLKNKMNFLIYEPSRYYKNKPLNSPKLTNSHLLLIKIKGRLNKFSNFRLQKTAFFMNVFSKEDFFKFNEYKYGPYSHSIDICSRAIREYQEYYSITTSEAEKMVLSNIISQSTAATVKKYEMSIFKAASFSNSIRSDKELEIVATITYLVKKYPDRSIDFLYKEYLKWPKENIEIINMEILCKTLINLEKCKVVNRTLLGYMINQEIDNLRMPKYCYPAN